MTTAAASTIESVVRRDRALVVASLIALTGLCWLYLFVLTLDMARGDMTLMGMAQGSMPWSALTVALMLLMWWIMMIGMMVPSAAPMILLFARVHRKEASRSESSTPHRPLHPRLHRRLGGVQLRGDGGAMGLRSTGLALADDGRHQQPVRSGAVPGRRRLPALTAQTYVPAPLPVAADLPREPLAEGRFRRVSDGSGPRAVLRRVLLVLDGAVVLRRRDESSLGRRDRDFRPGREGRAPRGELVSRISGAIMLCFGIALLAAPHIVG